MRKPTPPKHYTQSELNELVEIHCELVRTEILNYGEGGALWRRLQGLVADLPASPLLRMTNDALAEAPKLPLEDQRYVLTKIGAHVAFPIQENDAEFFEQLAVVLRARREKRPLNTLTAKELGIQRGRGRKAKPVDLSRAFPLALLGLTMKRSKAHAIEGEFTDLKISRHEILTAIQSEQLKAGQREPPVISETELSRWISNFNFQRFMVEQPIARKSRQKA
jgi:hypothetical protein